MKAHAMTLVTADEYYEALLRQLPKANRRVIIHAMAISWGPKTKRLAVLLGEAAKRGIEVRVVGDMYTRFYAYMPKLSRHKTPSWQAISAVNEQLRADGVQVTYIGRIGLNPFKNRCHSKITIIDDLVYTFGGVNFADDSLGYRDYMLAISDQALANQLYALVIRLEKDPKMPLPDTSERISPDTVMLYDGGHPGASIIYDTACEVVANARKVYFVSQMCPSGRLAKRIAATENECYFIHPNQAEPYAAFDLLRDSFRYGITNRYTGKAYIHAKFILAEGHDGSKHIVSGSNNFSWRGVAYGTKEIAAHSTDAALWQSFYHFLQKEIINHR